jgi:hypothetical protein
LLAIALTTHVSICTSNLVYLDSFAEILHSMATASKAHPVAEFIAPIVQISLKLANVHGQIVTSGIGGL